MTAYYQETDSKVVFALPGIHRPPTIYLANETTGSISDTLYFPYPMESALFKNAWKVVRQLPVQEMSKEAKKVLGTIQDIVVSFQQSKFDLTGLPPLNAFRVNDGSMYFEWTSSDFRVGFSVEPNPSESGWYLVSNKKLGEISASGYIAGVELKSLVIWLLSFVLSNS